MLTHIRTSLKLHAAAAILALPAVLAARAAADSYESPAVAIARAGQAGPPAPESPASAFADAAWRAFYVANDYTLARSYFQKAIEKDADLARAWEGYGRVLEVSGDYAGALRSYLKFIHLKPDHPAALIYLNRCRILEEDTNAAEEFEAALSALSRRADAPPLLRAKCLWFLFERAQRRADLTESEKLLVELAPIRTWRFVGAFDNTGKHGFEAAYPPEKAFALASVYEAKGRKIGWRRLPAPLPTGFFDLREVIAPPEFGVAYLAVAVHSPAARDAFLTFGAAGAVKVWLNRVEIFSNDSYHEGYFDQYIAPAPLAAGWNLLLVKICGDDKRWGFGARFLDERLEPLTTLRFDAGDEALAAAAKTPGRALTPVDDTSFFDGLLTRDPADAFNFYYAALEHATRNDTDETQYIPAKLLTAATATLPAADFFYHLAMAESETGLKRAHLAKCLELAPDHHQARLELAKYYYDMDKTQDALTELEEIIKNNPFYAEAAQYRAKINWEEGWGYDADAYARAINEYLPHYPFSKMVRALFQQNYGDLSAAVALWREIYEEDVFSSTARDNLVDLLCNTGDVEGALSVLNRALTVDPYNIEVRKKVIAVLDGHDRHAAALAAIDEALLFRPDDYELLSAKATALEKLGRDAEAREYYRRAIDAKRNFPSVENYLRYLQPPAEGPAAARRYDAYELIAAYPGDDRFPRDSAVWLLREKQVEVFGNGTYSTTVHEVIKILTPEGAQKFRDRQINYTPDSEKVEIKRAGVIKPSGVELAATQTRETNLYDVWSRLYYSYVARTITMPNLAPGDVIDFEYRVNQTGGNIFADYFGDTFYFGERNSVLKTRYVLTVPADKTFYIYQSPELPAPVVHRSGGKVTYVYEMTSLGPVEEEPYMPALEEILPVVQVSTFASWDDLGRWYTGLLKDVTRPSPEVEALAARLVADAADELTKVQRCYDFVVTNIRYVGLEFGIGGFRPHSPKQCLETLYGDCKDKATLLNALCRTVGITAYPALVRTADRGRIEHRLPVLGNFNHMISYVVLADGRGLFLDATAEYHGWKETPELDQGTDALIIKDNTTSFVHIPNLTGEENHLRARTVFALQNNGDANFHRVIRYGANDNPRQRERLHAPSQRKAAIAEYWNGLYAGTKIYNERFSGITDLNQPVELEYDGHIPRFFDAAATKVNLEAVIQKSGLIDIYCKKSSRRWPLVISRDEITTSEVTYVLPDGYEIVSAPLPKEFRSPYGFFKLEVDATPGRITVIQHLELKAQRVPPRDYAAFKELCATVDAWESEPIIIAKKH